MNITPRQAVEKVLRGGRDSKVPFTIYAGMLPQCATERLLRNRGLCMVQRQVPAFLTHRPNVKCWQKTYVENGVTFIRNYYETPVGTLTSLDQPVGFTTWHHERMFKSPDDYKAILFMIKDEQYAPNYEALAKAQEQAGEDFIFRAGFGLEPMQTLVSGPYLETSQFCIEWMDHRDEILELYHALVEKRRQVYELVARAPVLHANYGGNVAPEIIGLKMFKEYYVPHYHEAAEIMHRHGKLIGCHFDANCRLLAKAIAGTPLDYIEAFTPAPDTDMTLAEARAAWPNKTLWINYPSSIHLQSNAQVESFTLAMLATLQTTGGLIIGITENIPPERWQGSCTAIMNALDKQALKAVS